jgi:hypothetical protein
MSQHELTNENVKALKDEKTKQDKIKRIAAKMPRRCRRAFYSLLRRGKSLKDAAKAALDNL